MSGLRWLGNLEDPMREGPIIKRGLFQAGASQAITKGQMLERTNDTNTRWVPLDSDFDMTSGAGLAIAAEDIASGDLAGYHRIWVPMPGDVWEVELAAAEAIARATALYFSSATVLTKTAGTNILAYTVGEDHLPDYQKKGSKGQLGDEGETLRTVARVGVCFRRAVSYYDRLQAA